MRKILIALTVLAILLTSCSREDLFVGEGAIITKEISLANFDGIESFGNNNVTITRGAIQKVQVTGYSNIIDRLLTDVDNGIWEIELKDGRYKQADLNIQIVLPMLNEVGIQGSGEILVNAHSSNDNMKIWIYGSGKIVLNKNTGCKDLAIIIEGSGSVVGHNDFEDLINLKIETIGSGGFDGFPVNANSCDIKIEGSSVCNVSVEDILDVKLVGSGLINYKGNPTISTNISGSGRVIKSN